MIRQSLPFLEISKSLIWLRVIVNIVEQIYNEHPIFLVENTFMLFIDHYLLHGKKLNKLTEDILHLCRYYKGSITYKDFLYMSIAEYLEIYIMTSDMIEEHAKRIKEKS